jgi:YHS domain-containing protein
VNPLRILLLIFLFYILFRLLIGGKKRSARKSRREPFQANDILVEDPICNTCIPKKQATALDENGETVYFCSSECREEYQAKKGE